MSKIIIHISDLHITDSSGTFGQVNLDTYLCTEKSKKDFNYSFIDSIVKKIQNYYCENRFLIVTGDITNIAEQVEFDTAKIILKKIIQDLSIPFENILLIPGDHDVHRDSVKEALRQPENNNKKGYELTNIKFKNFQSLYNEIKQSDFESEKLIFDQFIIDDILVLGTNSNFYVDQNSSDGFLPIQRLDEELNEIKEKNNDKHIILVFHHNISGTHENKQSGQWNLENRKDLIPILLKHKVKCIFHGNEHTPKSLKLPSSEIYVSDSGALASKVPNGSFKIYEIQNIENSIRIKNNVIELRRINAIDEPNIGDWLTIPICDTSNEIEYFEIFDNKINTIEETIDILAYKDGKEELKEEIIIQIQDEKTYYNKEEKQAKLYDIVKNNKLYHSGHFHWSESSRAHNWIDVSKLLENKDDLHFVKNLIIDVIETFSLNIDCDLIIGLGYEGNIISSKASIKYDIPYSSLPYSYRYDDHHEYERKLNYQNDDGKFKKVIIITDVVNDGRTIRKLVKELENSFFEKVEKIIVISLFYSGSQDINIDILNSNKQQSENNTNDYIVNNIDFYAIKSLKVEKCPCNNNFREVCFIYRDKLSTVHKFYDENE